MPGGWTMSMAWMRMPGQTWSDAAAAFVWMWAAMMVPMMLPSIAPVLWRHRREAGVRSVSVAALAYFAVWIGLGAAVYPLGAGLAALTMAEPAVSRAVPLAAGAVVLLAGALQLTGWKARQLACCRRPDWPGARSRLRLAWRDGARTGVHCVACCAGLTAVLLVCGVMDPAVMAAVTAAVTLERVAPQGDRIARVSGGLAVALGVLAIARAIV